MYLYWLYGPYWVALRVHSIVLGWSRLRLDPAIEVGTKSAGCKKQTPQVEALCEKRELVAHESIGRNDYQQSLGCRF